MPFREFIHFEAFEKSWRYLGLTDADLRNAQHQIVANPRAGPVLRGSGGVRKLRLAVDNKGKSGGIRVFYLDIPIKEKVVLLFALGKAERENISDAELRDIAKLVKQIKEDL